MRCEQKEKVENEEEEDIIEKKKKQNKADQSITSTIVFVETVRKAQIFHLMLQKLAIRSVCLHSSLKQSERDYALHRFKSSWEKVMIATDVAARGLDIPQVDLVINYDLPFTSETYIHRIGRTARAGRSGRALSLISQYSAELFLRLESELGREIEEMKVEEKLALRHLNEVTTARVLANQAMKDSNFQEKFDAKKKKFLSYSNELSADLDSYKKSPSKEQRKPTKKSKTEEN